jgi:hypothetical protein
MSSVSVSVSREFLAEMTKVVANHGEYLVFDGQEEAINYLKDADCLIFKEEADIYEYITDTEERAEVMKEHLKDNYNCRIIDDGDECLVFEDMDEARQEVAENSEVGDVFSASAIESWVAENSSIEDVFDEDAILEHIGCCYTITDIYREDEIKAWVRENCAVDEVFSNTTLFGNPKGITKEEVEELEKENEALKKENEALKAKVADYKQLKTILTQLIMPSPHEQERNPRDDKKRPGFDGFVWTWNADAGQGEWC